LKQYKNVASENIAKRMREVEMEEPSAKLFS
jgi:hypothetical protein